MRLADAFCRLERRRIEERFRSLGTREQRRLNRLAGAVLDGAFRWLEEGIIEAPEARPAEPVKLTGTDALVR